MKNYKNSTSLPKVAKENEYYSATVIKLELKQNEPVLKF